MRAFFPIKRARGDELAVVLHVIGDPGQTLDTRCRYALRLLRVVMTAVCESALRRAEKQHGDRNKR